MTSVYATRAFWAGMAERTVETGATAALGVLGTGVMGVADVDWAVVASVSALAVVMNVLRCLAQPEFVSGVPRVPLEEAQAGVYATPPAHLTLDRPQDGHTAT